MNQDMKMQLPIWYHLGATRKLRRLNNTRNSDCLRENHGALIGADILRIARRVCYQEAKAGGNDYIPDDCACAECAQDRLTGCDHPRRCCATAEQTLDTVRPKWNPREANVSDGLSLTRRRRENNDTVLSEGGSLTFDPSITQSGALDEAFRVFVN
ncbi:hypothetical protein FOMPIDRAFT_62555, partial [Fomitopsis schrenkii]